MIILNWNTCGLLEKCLQSLTDLTETLPFEVVVVDNASSDHSREMVKAKYPAVRLIENPVNLGFGAGNNVAAPQTQGRYLLFLNSDTVVMENALSGIVAYADSRPEVGIVGAKLLNEDGSLQFSCRTYPNLMTGFFRNTPLGRLFPGNKFASDYLMQDWDHASPRDVDWVSGAALMLRRTLYDQIGAFDEDYFMYCEDVDLCYRANHAPFPDPQRSTGETWKVAYFPDSIIYHLIGKSSDLAPTRMTYEFHRSQYLFYRKHYQKTLPLWTRPVIPAGIALRAVGQMARFRVRYLQRKLRGTHRKKEPESGALK